MILIDCPTCGLRAVAEFRYGDAYKRRLTVEDGASDTLWTDYLYMRRNGMEVQTEWWYHAYGCGQWFLADRHTLTNEVLGTECWSRSDRHESSARHARDPRGAPGFAGEV